MTQTKTDDRIVIFIQQQNAIKENKQILNIYHTHHSGLPRDVSLPTLGRITVYILRT